MSGRSFGIAIFGQLIGCVLVFRTPDACQAQDRARAAAAQARALPPAFLHSRLITPEEAINAFNGRLHVHAGLLAADLKPDWFGSCYAYMVRSVVSNLPSGSPDHGWVCATDGSVLVATFNWPLPTRHAETGDASRPVSLEQAYKIAYDFVRRTYPGFAQRRWLPPSIPMNTMLDNGANYDFAWDPLVGLYRAAAGPLLSVTVDLWTGNITSYGEPDRDAFVAPPPPLVSREDALRLVRKYAPDDPDRVPTVVTLLAWSDNQGVPDLTYIVRQRIGQPPLEPWLSTLAVNAYTGRVWYPGGSFGAAVPAKGFRVHKPLPTTPFIAIPGVTPVSAAFTGPDGKAINSAEGVVLVGGAYYIGAEAFRALGARVTVDSKHVEIAANGYVRKPPILQARKIYGGWWVDVLSTAKLVGWPGSYDAKTNTLHVESDPVSFNNPFKLAP